MAQRRIQIELSVKEMSPVDPEKVTVELVREENPQIVKLWKVVTIPIVVWEGECVVVRVGTAPQVLTRKKKEEDEEEVVETKEEQRRS